MQTTVQTMTTEVERVRVENAELRQARGEARKESPVMDEASSSSTPNEAVFSELEGSMDAEDKWRARQQQAQAASEQQQQSQAAPRRQQLQATPRQAPATTPALASTAPTMHAAAAVSTTVKIKPTNPPPFN
ncbi:unnamed protein product [Closterium sp. NIES-54]